MTIQAFKEEEIAKIYKNKLIYSIIKYETQGEEFKELNKDKYLTAVNLCNISFDNSVMDEVINYLDSEKTKYEEISSSNQEVIDIVADEMADSLIREVSSLPSDLEKCKFLFEYFLKNFTYALNTKKYHRNIPFGEDYDFEFYKGIPTSKSYLGLLVTKTGLSDDIANLFAYLGTKIGLNINTVICECNDDNYMVNTIDIAGNLSYIDITSVLVGRCSIEDALLVDRSRLLNYARFNYVYDEGITQKVDFYTHYDFSKIMSHEKELLPEIEYIQNDIFAKEKTL